MPEEIMPHLTKSYHERRTYWIDNLQSDRHYDSLDWVDEENGEYMMVLDEARLRNLHSQLSEIIAKWDANL